MAAALLAALYPAFRTEHAMHKAMPWLLAGALAFAGVFLGHVTGLRADFAPGSEDASNLGHAVKNAWTLTGAVLALLPVYFIEKKYVRFEVRAVWYAQVLKVGLGLGLVVAVKTLLKAPLHAVLPAGPADAVRYFLLVMLAGCVWPMTFRYFSRLGKQAA